MGGVYKWISIEKNGKGETQTGDIVQRLAIWHNELKFVGVTWLRKSFQNGIEI